MDWHNSHGILRMVNCGHAAVSSLCSMTQCSSTPTQSTLEMVLPPRCSFTHSAVPCFGRSGAVGVSSSCWSIAGWPTHRSAGLCVVHLSDLPLAEGQRFRREWIEQSWRGRCEDVRGLVVAAVGIPLVLESLGFLALRTGRPVWVGFRRRAER
jgi:hypothetical protein